MADLPSHVQVAYNDAVSNIQRAKGHQWTVTNYSMILYGAIFAASNLYIFFEYRWLLAFAIISVALFHAFMIFATQRELTRFRSRLAWIYRTYFTAHQLQGLGLSPKSKPTYYQPMIPSGLLAISGVTAVLMLFIAYGAHNEKPFACFL